MPKSNNSMEAPYNLKISAENPRVLGLILSPQKMIRTTCKSEKRTLVRRMGLDTLKH